MAYKRIRRTAPRRRMFKRRRIVRKKRQTLRARIKKIALQNNETKFANGNIVIAASSFMNTLFTGNTISTPDYQTNLTTQPDYQVRDGRSIIHTGWYLKGVLMTLPTNIGEIGLQPITYLRIVCIDGGVKGAKGTTYMSGADNCFRGPNGTMNNYTGISNLHASMTYPIDRSMFNVLFDKVYKCDPKDYQSAGTRYITIRKRWNKKINFPGVGSEGEGAQDRNIYFVYWAYSPQVVDLFQPFRFTFDTCGFFKDPN